MLSIIGFCGIVVGIAEYILGWAWICLWIGHAILTIKSEKFIQLLGWNSVFQILTSLIIYQL
jgi:hypothetical protein